MVWDCDPKMSIGGKNWEWCQCRGSNLQTHHLGQIFFPLVWSMVKAVTNGGLKVGSIWVNRDGYFGGQNKRLEPQSI